MLPEKIIKWIPLKVIVHFSLILQSSIKKHNFVFYSGEKPNQIETEDKDDIILLIMYHTWKTSCD